MAGIRIISLLIVLFSGILTVRAQAPKYSNEFLSIGVGARSLAMGGSAVASVNDVTSGYWNPAGLAGLDSRSQVGLMHAEYFAGIAKYDYGSFARRIDSNSVFGVSLIRFGIDNIPNTIDLIDPNGNINYDRITNFSAADYAFLVSYARRLPVKGLSVGGNFKVVHRIVGDFATAWGFGLDAGAQYKVKNWRFGAMARDVTGTFNAWNFTLDERTREVWALTGNEIPSNSLEITLPKLLLGAARQVEIGKFTILGELGADFSFDGKRNAPISTKLVSGDPHLGLEGGFKNIVFLRAGIGNFQRVSEIQENDRVSYQPNIGVGIKIKAFTLDYALTDIGDQSVALYSNIFSLKIDINKPVQ